MIHVARRLETVPLVGALMPGRKAKDLPRDRHRKCLAPIASASAVLESEGAPVVGLDRRVLLVRPFMPILKKRKWRLSVGTTRPNADFSSRPLAISACASAQISASVIRPWRGDL